MTNIEKVKRILDAGHWVKATDKDWVVYTIYAQPEDWWVISYKVDDGELELFQINEWEDCTIEVIQRIPEAYNVGDKVLVLSNPEPDNEEKDALVWKVCEIYLCGAHYQVWDTNKSYYWTFPTYSLAPAFDDEKDTCLKLSGKEVTLVIDGKEYSAVMK